MTAEPHAHWDVVYTSKAASQLSWYRAHLQTSFELLIKAGLNDASRVLDIGGGASTLVDDLLTFGVREITVLDLSPASLDVARRRLGERSEKVSWIAADITTFDVAPGSFDLVHDRAALHFLVNPADPLKYVDVVTRALPIGGCAVIGCFSRTGPEKCSGLPVARRNPEDLADLFGANFSLIEGRLEPHHTPGGSTQQFAYALLRKIS